MYELEFSLQYQREGDIISETNYSYGSLLHIMEVVEDVKKIIKDLQVFGEKADHANKLITMNKNILENINLTDKFHQLHESSIEVKLNKEEEEENKHEHSTITMVHPPPQQRGRQQESS